MRYLELVLIDALLHLQSLFDIEIDELTVLITYDTIELLEHPKTGLGHPEALRGGGDIQSAVLEVFRADY